MSNEVQVRNLATVPPALNAWEAPILRYDPSATGTGWDYLITRPYEERLNQLEIDPEGSVWDPRIVGVDASGNIYVFYWIVYGEIEAEQTASDLIKYGPAGNELWHLSEQDFGGDWFGAPIMIGPDAFLFYFPQRATQQWAFAEDHP